MRSRQVRSVPEATATTTGQTAERRAELLLARVERVPFGRFHWVLLLSILAALGFDHMDQITLSFVIPEYSREWGLTPLQARWNPILGLSGVALGAIVIGRLGDRLGRKNLLMISLAVFAVTSAVNGFAPSFACILICCFVMGLGVGGAIPQAFTLLSEYMPARIRGWVEILAGMLAIIIGYALAAGGAILFLPLEGGQLGPHVLGWRTLFLIGVGPLAIIAFIARYVPESIRYLIARGRWEEAEEVVRRIERQAGLRPEPALAWIRTHPDGSPPRAQPAPSLAGPGDPAGLFSPRLRARTLMAWVYGLTWGFFLFGFLTWLPSVLHRVGYAAGEAGTFGFMTNALAVPSAFLTAYLFLRWSTKWTLAAYPIIAGVAMLLFGWVLQAGLAGPLILVALGGAIFFFGATLSGAYHPYTTEIYPVELRTTGAGWAAGLSRVGAVTGLALGGWLLAQGATPLLTYTIFGAPLFVAGLVMAWLGIETRQKRLEEI